MTSKNVLKLQISKVLPCSLPSTVKVAAEIRFVTKVIVCAIPKINLTPISLE